MDRIDILLATYNGESYLEQQVQSILNQTYPNIHLYVSDDHSTDQTLQCIERFKNNGCNSITIMQNKESLGPSGNFSKLLSHSQAPYIMFCDQDDVWDRDKVELTYRKMKETEANFNGPILVHTDLQVVNEVLENISDSYWNYTRISPKTTTLNRLLVQNVVTGCTTMLNRQLIDLTLPIPKSAIMHDWWIALVAASLGKVVPLEKTTMQYRQHKKNCIGATQFGSLKHITQALKRNTIFKKRKREQAADLLMRFNDVFDGNTRSIIESYCKLIDRNYLSRIYAIYKYKYYRQGFWRNLTTLFLTP